MKSSGLDLVVAGTQEAVMMVESEAKELPEETMLAAVMFGMEQFRPVIDMIIDLAEDCAKEPWDLVVPDHGALLAQLEQSVGADLGAAYAEPLKQARHDKVAAVKARALELHGGEAGENASG